MIFLKQNIPFFVFNVFRQGPADQTPGKTLLAVFLNLRTADKESFGYTAVFFTDNNILGHIHQASGKIAGGRGL